MKKVKKILLAMISILLPTASKSMAMQAYNFGDPTQIGDALEIFKPRVNSMAGIIMSIALYISIVIVGMNIIIYRNKPDERSSAMTGVLYIAIGVLIFTSAYLICGLIYPEGF